MSRLPSMPLFVADYLADTAHLSIEESGAYLHLLMGMWVRDGYLPDDDRDLAAITKSSLKKWRAMRPRLMPFLTVTDEGLTQDRLLKERDFVRGKTESRRAAGARGNEAQRQQKQQLNARKATAVADALTLTPNSSSSKKNPPTPQGGGAGSVRKRAKKGRGSYPDAFNLLVATYVRRPDDSALKQAFDEWDKFADEQQAVMQARAEWERDQISAGKLGTQYRFKLFKWIRDRHWEANVEYLDERQADVPVQGPDGEPVQSSGPPPGDGLANAGHVRGRDDEVQPEPQSPPSPAMGRSSKRCASASGMGGVLRSESAAPETEGGSFVARSSWDTLRAELRCAAEVAKRDDGPAGRRPTPTDRSHYH